LLQRWKDRRQPKRDGGGNPQAGTSKLELPGAMESLAMEDCGDHPRSEAIAKVLRNSSRKLQHSSISGSSPYLCSSLSHSRALFCCDEKRSKLGSPGS
jgi:hypothetical protein